MKTTGFRSIVLYLLVFAFLGGLGYLGVNLVVNGSRWAMQPYNGHVSEGSVKLGDITDRDGTVLATSKNGAREYSESETVRRSLLHTVGDTDGYIGTSVQATLRSKLSGYNLITGLNNTFLTQLGKNVQLTVDADVCAAAYNALGDLNGAVMVYNYETGDVVCKVSKPAFDPMNVPEDIENNDAYKGVYLDNNLSGSYTPGSIFKIVTAAAAMDKWPDSWQERTYTCTQETELGGDQITCLGYHGEQDLYAAMGNSCNIYFAELASDIGAADLQKKAEQMGFNRELRMGSIPIEKSACVLSKANTNELGWAGVGQYTVQANPYHMLVLMGAIANGGEYTEPRLTGDGDLFGSLTKGDSRKLMDSAEAGKLKSLMRSDVENYYGDYLFPEGWNVCAKTGTGEVGEGKAPNCWIVGFCDNPAVPYAFVVVAEQGVGGIETAGNAASQILTALSIRAEPA